MIERITVVTRSRERLEDVTHLVSEAIRRSGVIDGLCHLFVPHTTAGILVNENDDPAVLRDILERLEALVPQDKRYHHLEGNAHAHIKASVVGNALTLPVMDGRLALGRWQAVFMAEFDGPRDRTLIITVVPVLRGVPAEGDIPEEFRRGLEP
ncbi:MAG TPA: secondary thiamine-phosphate synthase enzyme YjbQ [Dehalococcoidia bacterium]|nr:secondary thiamine-phosphate synthase enzyme YjbQ [Dehalococcoidia bacterium]